MCYTYQGLLLGGEQQQLDCVHHCRPSSAESAALAAAAPLATAADTAAAAIAAAAFTATTALATAALTATAALATAALTATAAAALAQPIDPATIRAPALAVPLAP